MQRVRHLAQNAALATPDMQLLALIPDILGRQYFGEVEPLGDSWRWTFREGEVDRHGALVATQDAAMADLRTIQIQL